MTLAISAVGTAAIGFTLIAQPAWRLSFNPSLSAPRGFYLLAPLVPQARHAHEGEGPSERGRLLGLMVLAWPPAGASRLAEQRDYVPGSVPLLKSVSGAFRDRVCRFGAAVTINGRLTAIAWARDRVGRALPVWQGCRRLHPGEVFLLGVSVDSFDGRYFGPVGAEALIVRARPLWTW